MSALATIAALWLTHQAIVQSDASIKISQDSQFADRFASASADVGSEVRDVRANGVYALERLMKDFPKDQPIIVRALVNFVRDHSQRSSDEKQRFSLGFKEVPGAMVGISPAPPSDVAAALDALRSRDASRDGTVNFDLRNVDLRGANLRGISLQGVDFTQADLRGADLTGADLEGMTAREADFSYANLSNANLDDSGLTWSYLSEATLRKAKFRNASLSSVQFSYSDIRAADFSSADIHPYSILDAQSSEKAVLPKEIQEYIGSPSYCRLRPERCN